MPFAYYSPGHIKVEILQRVAAGEIATAVCREPGMPSIASIYAWARADPDFAANLAHARRQCGWRRRWMFDQSKADALIERLRTGERITSILSDPAMPSRNVYRYWRAHHRHFQEEVSRLNALRVADRITRIRARFREFDQTIADRILVRVSKGESLDRVLVDDPQAPSRNVFTRWRRAHPDYDGGLRIAIRVGHRRRSRSVCRRTPDLTEEIVRRLREGACLASLGREPDMPCASTLYGWVSRSSEFAEEIARACDDREDWYLDRVMMLADAVTVANVDAIKAAMAPLKRRHAQLQNRPGRKWRTPPS